jgi:hypothetical protein
MTKSLGEALPEEIARVNKIIAEYRKYPGGMLSASVMEANVHRAVKALAEGDVVTMIREYEELKTWEL